MAGAVAGRCNGLAAAAEAITELESSVWTDAAAEVASAATGAGAATSAKGNLTSSSLLMLLNRLAMRLFGTLSRVPKYLLTYIHVVRH
jgi:hypothetical protein